MKEKTKLLHAYQVLDPYTGAASIPLYQTSTFHHQHLYDNNQNYLYTRFGNPTLAALEDGLRSLTNADYALCFASGMAAISNTLMLLHAGEHLLLPKEVYGGTCQFVTQILPKYQIDYTFVDMADIEAVRKAWRPNTRMLYIETPSNPLLKVCDIRKLVAFAKEKNLISVADNTFMTSLSQEPLALGIDIVVESITKFINGHSDVLAGLIATNSKDYYDTLQLFQKNFGAILGVEDAWLILRGMKTMVLRMEQAVANAQRMAIFLEQHPKIKAVHYPGLASHLNHDIHLKQAKDGGAVLSFELSSHEDLMRFTEKVKLPILAVSLGGVESILSHPATMSHACLTARERAEQGVGNELLRLSCGIEDITDLIEDFEQALLD